MRTLPELRQRYDSSGAPLGLKNPVAPSPSTKGIINTLTGGLSRIAQGVFGMATPQNNASSEVNPGGNPVYTFHEGDLFTPGTQNWARDPSHELPINTLWGYAFLRKPNTFNPIQPAQSLALKAGTQVGVGGLQAGSIIFQPLDYEGE